MTMTLGLVRPVGLNVLRPSRPHGHSISKFTQSPPDPKLETTPGCSNDASELRKSNARKDCQLQSSSSRPSLREQRGQGSHLFFATTNQRNLCVAVSPKRGLRAERRKKLSRQPTVGEPCSNRWQAPAFRIFRIFRPQGSLQPRRSGASSLPKPQERCGPSPRQPQLIFRTPDAVLFEIWHRAGC